MACLSTGVYDHTRPSTNIFNSNAIKTSMRIFVDAKWQPNPTIFFVNCTNEKGNTKFGAERDLRIYVSLFTVLYQEIHVRCCESYQDCDISKQTMTRNEIVLLQSERCQGLNCCVLAKWITHATVFSDLSCFGPVFRPQTSHESNMCDQFCKYRAVLA